MSWPIQDHCDAFLAVLTDTPGSPALVVCDGKVPDGTVPPYALVYFQIETPDGTALPEWIPLTGQSVAINARAIVHSVGGEPEAPKAARAVAGRVRAAVLDQTLTVAGWSCNPIRWIEGQPPQRNEEVPGAAVFDQVDVYGWTATSS